MKDFAPSCFHSASTACSGDGVQNQKTRNLLSVVAQNLESAFANRSGIDLLAPLRFTDATRPHHHPRLSYLVLQISRDAPT